MSSSRRLRDQPGVCFPQRRGASRSPASRRTVPRQAAMDFSGVSLANYMEEPEREITEFLRGNPTPDQISQLLVHYKAYVIDLALKANDLRVNECHWQAQIPTNITDSARSKFSHLNSRTTDLDNILGAYREATVRLIRAVRRQLNQTGIAVNQTLSASQSRGLFDVGKIVSSGLEILFGEPSLSDAHIYQVNVTKY